MQTYSIKDARNNLAELIEQVDKSGSGIILTKYGQPKVVVSKYYSQNDPENKASVVSDVYGMWQTNSYARQQTRNE